MRSPSARKVWIEIGISSDIKELEWSPSARKVWIEMYSVERLHLSVQRHLPQGRCGLKLSRCHLLVHTMPSPSARKVWIEIEFVNFAPSNFLSPSARKVWIEILLVSLSSDCSETSPSARKVWIEIHAESSSRLN